jgi:hypothetical protein
MATGRAVLGLVSIAALLKEGLATVDRLGHELRPVTAGRFSLFDTALVLLSCIGLCLAGSEVIHHARMVVRLGLRRACAQLALWLTILVGCYYGISFAILFAPGGLLIWFGLYLLFWLVVAFQRSGDRFPGKSNTVLHPEEVMSEQNNSSRSIISARFRPEDV